MLLLGYDLLKIETIRVKCLELPDSFSTSRELPHHHQEGEEDLRGPEEVEKTDLLVQFWQLECPEHWMFIVSLSLVHLAVEEDHLADQM